MWRNPLSKVRSTTIGIIGLTGMWAGFQWLDPTPPPVLDQLLVAAFGIWFATEAKRNTVTSTPKRKKKDAKDSDDEDDDDDDQ